ncbi:asparagine synthase (glutamine-hydrolyzing) [Caenimonas aquaedulcis]|uniref:asparagine synthase (glutamine-hydrolyzing) n=1 Tax=Caenimonas aquaedulcis TaxID=2793270 RepID=A0A931H5Q3_9BURK|nr:asparagine synthase (glutamine-hydrolyzing) [Caenimonas aquaedulcis]MBG9389066.1 asparagine synthase (glutamine-hydrolyzing) [Caenimonas aquaedulcis]
MCGIAGWMTAHAHARPLSQAVAMADLMRHRGPDDSGSFEDTSHGVAFAHRRLSIIDLAPTSHQPMMDAATGIVLAYNGELYNFRELRRELQARGHRFASSGDTEVVLRAFIEWGAACLERFCGMFALALWDPRTRTVHLARDATGMKPLYYLARPDGLVFASEVKAFRALPDFRAEADRAGLAQYMEFGYVFETGRTILDGVAKLEPGQRMELREGRIAAHVRWFTPPAPDAADTRDEAERIEELAQAMRRVVGEHLVADVPLGLLLSGGLDSSVVAALARREGPLLTISMGFDRSGIDERPNAREVAGFIGSRHLEVLVTADEVRREAMQGAWVFDDLFADWGTVTTRLLYRRCREQGIKVVLVGEGADELFGGYDIFRGPARLGPWGQFRLYQKYAGRRHGSLFGAFRGVFAEYLAAAGGDAFHAIRLFESCRQLPNQYVMKVDKASMAESVEARAPYLDRRVAELAWRTPLEWLLRGGENKYLLRAMARREGLLPAAASARPKFGAPLAAEWMDSDPGFRAFAREQVLGGGWSRRLGLGGAMAHYFDKGRTGYAFPHPLSILRNVAWRVLLLELWSRHYLEA